MFNGGRNYSIAEKIFICSKNFSVAEEMFQYRYIYDQALVRGECCYQNFGYSRQFSAKK
jgi:hypothetical protein